jgi:hypothetical protein
VQLADAATDSGLPALLLVGLPLIGTIVGALIAGIVAYYTTKSNQKHARELDAVESKREIDLRWDVDTRQLVGRFLATSEARLNAGTKVADRLRQFGRLDGDWKRREVFMRLIRRGWEFGKWGALARELQTDSDDFAATTAGNNQAYAELLIVAPGDVITAATLVRKALNARLRLDSDYSEGNARSLEDSYWVEHNHLVDLARRSLKVRDET